MTELNFRKISYYSFNLFSNLQDSIVNRDFLCFKPVPVTSKKANSKLSQIVYELKLTNNTNKSYKIITKLYLTNNDCILQT